MLKRLRNGSSGFVMSLNAKFLPTVVGVNRFITMPCGTYTKPKRGVCFTLLANAGTIASSIGSATAAPKPCRNVRRRRCFLVMNIAIGPRKPLV